MQTVRLCGVSNHLYHLVVGVLNGSPRPVLCLYTQGNSVLFLSFLPPALACITLADP